MFFQAMYSFYLDKHIYKKYMPVFKGWKITPWAELCYCRMDSYTDGYLQEKQKGSKIVFFVMRQFRELSGRTVEIFQ